MKNTNYKERTTNFVNAYFELLDRWKKEPARSEAIILRQAVDDNIDLVLTADLWELRTRTGHNSRYTYTHRGLNSLGRLVNSYLRITEFW